MTNLSIQASVYLSHNRASKAIQRFIANSEVTSFAQQQVTLLPSSPMAYIGTGMLIGFADSPFTMSVCAASEVFTPHEQIPCAAGLFVLNPIDPTLVKLTASATGSGCVITLITGDYTIHQSQ